MKIILVCNQGLSTSILVNRMRTAIQGSEKLKDKDIVIEAWGKEEYIDHVKGAEIILLGPQIAMALQSIEEELQKNHLNIPVRVIDKEQYGTMNAVGVIKFAFNEIKKSK